MNADASGNLIQPKSITDSSGNLIMPEGITPMTKDQIREYFYKHQNDKNFHLLPIPRFLQEEDPQTFAPAESYSLLQLYAKKDYIDSLDKDISGNLIPDNSKYIA